MEIIDTGIIYRNPIPHVKSRHAYFPSIAKLQDGRMIAAFTIGEAFESADLHGYTAISEDEGQTWMFGGELCERVADYSDFSRISTLPSGELIAMMQRHKRTRYEQGLANPVTMGFTETEFYLQKSGDGAHWSTPQEVVPPLVGPSFEMCCPIVPLSDGTLLFPTSTWRGWDGDEPNGMKAVAFLSRDSGKTWSEYVDVMRDDKHEIIYWESRVAELPDGRLLATAWGYDEKKGVDLPNQFAIGNTNGFLPPCSTGLLGQTLEPTVLANGKILSVYRRTDKPGLWANISAINGTEWVNECEKLLWCNNSQRLFAAEENMVENFNVLKFGAPRTIYVGDDTYFICFWCVEDNVSNIRWIKLRVV